MAKQRKRLPQEKQNRTPLAFAAEIRGGGGFGLRERENILCDFLRGCV